VLEAEGETVIRTMIDLLNQRAGPKTEEDW
jgi:hypothetical protein